MRTECERGKEGRRYPRVAHSCSRSARVKAVTGWEVRLTSPQKGHVAALRVHKSATGIVGSRFRCAIFLYIGSAAKVLRFGIWVTSNSGRIRSLIHVDVDLRRRAIQVLTAILPSLVLKDSMSHDPRLDWCLFSVEMSRNSQASLCHFKSLAVRQNLSAL
jgi:hypothetical protein